MRTTKSGIDDVHHRGENARFQTVFSGTKPKMEMRYRKLPPFVYEDLSGPMVEHGHIGLNNDIGMTCGYAPSNV